MRMAMIEKEWAEVRRNGEKPEDWSWTVSFYEGAGLIDGDWIDRHYIKNEADAKMRAALFKAGEFTYTEYGAVCFETNPAFA